MEINEGSLDLEVRKRPKAATAPQHHASHAAEQCVIKLAAAVVVQGELLKDKAVRRVGATATGAHEAVSA